MHSVYISNSSILPINRTLSGATTPGQSKPGSNSNEGVLCTSLNTNITGTSPSYCLVFNIALNILVWLPSNFFFSHLVSVQVVHPYSSTDTTAAWKKLRFILSVRSDWIRPGHSFWSYPSAEMQSVYATVQTDWTHYF